MKITFLLNQMHTGGGVRVVFEYANRLQKKNHQVSIVYPAIDLARLKRLPFGAFVVELVALCVQNTIRRGHQQPFDTASLLIKVPVLYPRFMKLIERSIPDADVIVATAWETTYAVNELGADKGEKFYFVQSYEIWDLWNETACWKAARKLKRGDEKCSLAMAAVTPEKKSLKKSKELADRAFKLPLKKITIAEWLRHLIEDKFGEHVEGVIPNGVNFEIFFKEGSHREESREVNVLMPYRPAKFKGFQDGLDAFERIRMRHPNAHFEVFGIRPRVVGRLRKLPEWIDFHHIKSDAQLRALYNKAHIFVLPSWIEGFPLPPMEAMACGCAVVTTDAGGVSDYLRNGETALIVPIQDPAALAQSVCKLIEDEGERRRVAKNGYSLIKQFTWEKSTQRLIEFINRDI